MSRPADARRVDLLVLSSFPPGVGGGEIQTRAQLLGMVRRGHRVHVIDLEPRHGGPALEDDEGIVVHRVRTPRAPLARAAWYHATIAALAWRLGRHARVAQINHLGTGLVTAAPLLERLGVPRALVVWGSATRGVGPFGPGWRNRLARSIARRQSVIVSLSSATSRNLVDRGFPEDRVRFIPNGVDTERFRPVSDRDGPWSPPPGWPSEGPIAVTVGRLVAAKGLDVLLRAWRDVARVIPAARLVVVGDGPLRRECEALVSECGVEGSVVLLGARSDVPEILRRCDLYVSSSRTEGMSNALLEGLASGLPLVATRVGGAEDIVEDATNGRLLPPEDARTLAGALTDVLSDSVTRRSMGEASRRIALERFALDAIVQRYLALFDEIETTA